MEKPVSFKSFVVSAALVCGFAAVGFAESAVTVEVTATTELGLPPNQWVTYAPSAGMLLLVR